MRTVIPILASVFFFSSCSRYQYMVISSDDTPFVNGKYFEVENDTFRVVYNFSGYGGPLQLSVINKSKAMMEVDWEKSFFITGNKSRQLFTPASKIEGEVERETSDGRTFSLSGSLLQQSQKQYIPPGTAVSKVCGEVAGRFINTETYKMHREKVNVKGFSKKIRRVSLDKQESPVNFRVYLTLRPEDGKYPVVIDRSFFISELVATKVAPDDMPPSENNVVTVSKFTRVGGVLAAVGGIGAILLLAYLAGDDAAINNQILI
jgi:hypothetical protein